MNPCLECGEPTSESRCPRHRLPSSPKATPESRGYDETWRKLSKRARRLQPWCTDCGGQEDLTADHNAVAWERRAAGKVIRLEDIDVVCRRCNANRGRTRPGGDDPDGSVPYPLGQAKSRIHTGGGYE